MADTLKNGNRPTLLLLLLVNLGLFSVLLATNRLIFPDAPTAVKEWQSLIPAGGAVFVVALLNEQLSPLAKARLVFWRWEEPLPGREAFTKHGPADSRIDMTSLQRKLGTLPEAPGEQNRAWYRLYRSLKGEPAITDAHRAFLLYRDCTAIIAMLIVPLTLISIWKVEPDSTAYGFGALLVSEYLLFKRAASVAGVRFVTTVLAIKAAEA